MSYERRMETEIVYTTQHNVSIPENNDLEAWTRLYKEQCPPCTYPPCLWVGKLETGPLVRQFPRFWRKIYAWTRYVAVCRRCGERLSTFHVCKDLQEYWKSQKEDSL